MELTEKTTIERQIQEYMRKSKNAYSKEYRSKNPEKVKQWRINEVLNRYRRIVAENPELFIEREEIMR